MAGWPPAVSPSAHSSAGVQLCSLGENWAPWPAVITPLNQGCNPITMQSAMRAPAPRPTELTEDGGRSSAQIWKNSEDVLSPCLYFHLSSPLSYWTPDVSLDFKYYNFFLTDWWIDMIYFVLIPSVYTDWPHYSGCPSFSLSFSILICSANRFRLEECYVKCFTKV